MKDADSLPDPSKLYLSLAVILTAFAGVLFTVHHCRVLLRKIKGNDTVVGTREETVDALSAWLRNSYKSTRLEMKDEIQAMQQLQADVATQLEDLKSVLAQYKALQNQNSTGRAKQD